MELDKITSYEILFCADCKLPITEHNDSGWEVFTDKTNKTQPICITCNIRRNNTPGIKANI